MHQAGHRSYLSNVTAILAAVFMAAALQSLSAAARAADASPVGEWQGTIQQGDRTVVAEFTVTELQLGRPSGRMKWGEPRKCWMDTEYGGASNGKHVFNIAETYAPWCNLYFGGYILATVSKNGAPTLSFELNDKKKERTLTGKLQPRP